MTECLPMTMVPYYLANHSPTTLNNEFWITFPSGALNFHEMLFGSPFMEMTALENRKLRSRDLSQLWRF